MTERESNFVDTETLNSRKISAFGSMWVDLACILGITLLALILASFITANDSIARPAVGLLFLFFVPGYVLVAALFPGKGDVSSFERAVLSVGLSIATVALIGFVLNYAPGGINFQSYQVSVCVLTVALTAIAIVRRGALPFDKRFSIDVKMSFSSIRDVLFHAHRDRSDKALSIMFIIVVLAAASLCGYVIASPKQSDTFTELYVLGQYGTLANYSTTFHTGTSNPVTVGITNHEKRPVTYELVVALNDGNQSSTLYSERFKLNDTENRAETINVTPTGAGQNQMLQIILYADGNKTSPYRENHLWVNVTA